VDGTAFAVPGLRVARSAAVVSVVSDAATRCVWRFVLAAAAALLRWVDVEAAEARAARTDLVASPRADAAFEEAERDAVVRFEPGLAVDAASDAASDAPDAPCSVPAAGAFRVVSSASGDDGAVAALVFDVAGLAAADFAVAVFDAAVLDAADFAAAFLAVDAVRAVVLVVSPDVSSGRELVRRVGAPSEAAARDAAVFDAAPFAAEDRAVRDAAAAPDFEVVERAVRFAAARGVRGALDGPPSADTPVPVPSGASSS